jgi:hypothetical protein
LCKSLRFGTRLDDYEAVAPFGHREQSGGRVGVRDGHTDPRVSSNSRSAQFMADFVRAAEQPLETRQIEDNVGRTV